MTEDGIAAFPASPDLRPLTVPEVLASLLLATMTARAGCTAASVDGVNDFVADTFYAGMDSLHARGLVVPYRHPGVLVTESVAWDIDTIAMLAERSLADMLSRGLLKDLGRETDGRPRLSQVRASHDSPGRVRRVHGVPLLGVRVRDRPRRDNTGLTSRKTSYSFYTTFVMTQYG